MTARPALLTYRDYAALPDDGRRYELHDGELSVTPAPSTRHQRTAARLYEVLHHHVERLGLGEVLFAPLDVILSDLTVVQPDLVYIDTGRSSLVSERGIEGPPALVVEILSLSTATLDRVTKPRLYARHRVPFLWLVDPDRRTVEAFALGEAGYGEPVIASGPTPAALPPFPDLPLVPDALWP